MQTDFAKTIRGPVRPVVEFNVFTTSGTLLAVVGTIGQAWDVVGEHQPAYFERVREPKRPEWEG